MMKWQNLLMSVAIIALTQSCSNLKSYHKASSTTLAKTEASSLVHVAPDIPFNKEEAFFPLRENPEGEIVPSYQWKECVKRFIICLKWKKKTIYFKDLSWFYANEYGLSKRRK